MLLVEVSCFSDYRLLEKMWNFSLSILCFLSHLPHISSSSLSKLKEAASLMKFYESIILERFKFCFRAADAVTGGEKISLPAKFMSDFVLLGSSI